MAKWRFRFATRPSSREGVPFVGAESHIVVVKWQLLLATSSSLREGVPFAGPTSRILVAKCGPLWDTMPSLREGVPFLGARLRILVVKLGFSISTRLSRAAGFLCKLSCRLPFFRRNFQHLRKTKGSDRQSVVFYRRLWPPRGAGPRTQTLSRIRPPGALGLAIWATRPPAGREKTPLSDRPFRILVVTCRLFSTTMPSLREGAPFACASSHILVAK